MLVALKYLLANLLSSFFDSSSSMCYVALDTTCWWFFVMYHLEDKYNFFKYKKHMTSAKTCPYWVSYIYLIVIHNFCIGGSWCICWISWHYSFSTHYDYFTPGVISDPRLLDPNSWIWHRCLTSSGQPRLHLVISPF